MLVKKTGPGKGMTYSGMLWMAMPHHPLLSTCRLEELNPQMICTKVKQYLLPPHRSEPNISAQRGALNTVKFYVK